MQLSIRNIIGQINAGLTRYFQGATFYGVATLIDREGKLQPVVESKSVSFDDDYALQMYHKLSGVTIQYKPGYGDLMNTINTFQLNAIVFNNENKTLLKSDEIAMIIQAALSQLNISQVRILPTSIVLNSPAIFSTEYRGHEYRLTEYTSLLQLNYVIEITFKSGCFDLCPGDFSQCKN